MFCENNKYTIFYFDLLICQAHGFDDQDFTQVCFLKSHSLIKRLKSTYMWKMLCRGQNEIHLKSNDKTNHYVMYHYLL